jgi:carboxymethylenebutenolidase
MALVPLLEANQARAALVSPEDQRLEIARTTYPGATGDIKAYMAYPKGSAKLPAVIVIHENRGLNPHIEDVTRRLALDGFLAFAPDLLSPAGGTPANEDTARDMINKLDAKQTVQNLVSAIAFLEKHAQGNGKVGAVGFCWGGAMVNFLATRLPDLAAGVPFYGTAPSAEEAAKIKTPLLITQGANDPRVNKRESDQIVIALRERNYPVEYLLAPDEGHGYARPVNNMAVLAAAERFLAKHLGGRFQESMPPEVSERLKVLTVDVKQLSMVKKPTEQ